MEIPHKVRMGGHTITVVMDPKLAQTEDAVGLYEHERLRIRVQSDMLQTLKEEVFIHELVEAACVFGEIELDHSQLQTLAVHLHQALTSSEGSS